METPESFGQRIENLDLGLFIIPSVTTAIEKESLLYIQRCVRRHKNYCFLEIGSHLGGSMQPYYIDPKCTTIISIDKRPAVQPDERGRFYEYFDNSTQRMLDNLRETYPSIDSNKVITFDDDAANIPKDQIKTQPDICFIDGEHTNKAVMNDFLFCYSVAKPDTVYAFHDSCFVFEGIKKIEKFLTDKKVKFSSLSLGESVHVILPGEAVNLYSNELSKISKDKEQYFKESRKRLRSYRNASKRAKLIKNYPGLYSVYKHIKYGAKNP